MSIAIARTTASSGSRFLLGLLGRDLRWVQSSVARSRGVQALPAAPWVAPASLGGSQPSVRHLSDSPAKKPQKTKKTKSQGKGADASGRSKELDLILASLDAPSKKEGPISDEERERRYHVGRNYVIGRFRQHNDLDHDLTCKIHLKRHALKMLKQHERLSAEALKIDDNQVAPMWRNMAVWTPPIPGFDPSQFIQKDDK